MYLEVEEVVFLRMDYSFFLVFVLYDDEEDILNLIIILKLNCSKVFYKNLRRKMDRFRKR